MGRVGLPDRRSAAGNLGLSVNYYANPTHGRLRGGQHPTGVGQHGRQAVHQYDPQAEPERVGRCGKLHRRDFWRGRGTATGRRCGCPLLGQSGPAGGLPGQLQADGVVGCRGGGGVQSGNRGYEKEPRLPG